MPVYLRRIIFWLFVVVFCIIGPALVLYTAGYRLNWQNGQVIRTGVISISTEPRGATVSLNAQTTFKKTPYVFKQLLPGPYDVEITRDEYLPWSGTVEVQSGQTVSLQNVLLYLDRTSESLFQKDLETLSVHPDGVRLAYLIGQAGWSELWLYDLTTLEHRLISQSVQGNTEGIEVLWSSGGGYLALVETGEDPNLFSTDGTPLAIDLPAQTITRVSWHPSTDHLLYISTSEGFYQYDLITSKSSLIEETGADSIQLDASLLNFHNNGSQIEVQQVVGSNKTVLALLPIGSYELVERNGSFLLLKNTRGEIILLEIHANEPILLQRTASSYDWLAQQRLLVYSDGSEVNVYNATTHETTFLTRQTLPIESVQWHPLGQHVIVQDIADIQAYEYTPLADARYITTLLDTIDVDQWWLDDHGKTLYLYGLKDGAYSFFKRELMKETLSF